MSIFPPFYRNLLLSLVWGSAVLGLAVHVFWINAPRPVYVLAYIVVGVLPLVLLPQVLHYGGTVVLVCILTGGVSYILGAVIYSLKRPNISKKWYGFHELFHSLTVVGYALDIVAIFFAVLR
jgi:hemolysin III